MDRLEKAKYSLSVSEGSGDKLTEIQVKRVDGDPISKEEVGDLLSEFKRLFPKNTYRMLHETKPQEDDEILHIYINLEQKERLQRSHTLGKRVIVPKTEVEERLKSW